jgi:hypothetical protein
MERARDDDEAKCRGRRRRICYDDDVKKERALVSSFPFTSNLEILALFSCHPLHLQFSLVSTLSLLVFIYLIASLFDANTTGEALFLDQKQV